MVVFSTLRGPFQHFFRTFAVASRSQQTILRCQTLRRELVRYDSGPRKMVVRPSRYMWDKFKDQMHLYLMLGLGPIFLLIAWANIFVGQAELVDIPEGYHPKPHEYHKSPITRWFAQHIFTHYERDYEMYLHFLNHNNKKRLNRQLSVNIQQAMAGGQDYRGWYWMPVPTHGIESARREEEDLLERRGMPSG